MSGKHICNAHSRLQSGAFPSYMSPLSTSRPVWKRGFGSHSSCHPLICSYYTHQKARGQKPLDPLTNPSHFIKCMMIKSCVCFQRSCEARWGGPHSEAPARRTQGSAEHLVPSNSEFGASASLSLFPEAVNNLRKTHPTANGGKRRWSDGLQLKLPPELSQIRQSERERMLSSHGQRTGPWPQTDPCFTSTLIRSK